MSSHNRLDPTLLSDEERAFLADVSARPGHVLFVDDQGRQRELPSGLFGVLMRVARLMVQGRPIVMIPEDEALTTQAAANHLGVSRQHLVNLLEAGELPFHMVGTHRRVAFRDLLAYERTRDTARRRALDTLMDTVDTAGLYDASYTGDPAETEQNEG